MTGVPRIVVIGAGPAGLAASGVAARVGAAVTVIDEQTVPGGQLRYRAQPIEPAQGEPAARPDELVERLVSAARDAGATIETGALAAGLFPGNEVLVVSGDRARLLAADAVIVATGSTDLPFPFAGGTYPGVFTARAVQILMNQWRVRPGRRFAILGTGPIVDELAVDILLGGGQVAWSGAAPAPFLRAHGRQGVRRLSVGQDEIAVDVVVVAVGRQPDAALATMAGVPLAFAGSLGGLTPVVDERLQSPVSGLFVAGDAAGAGSVAAAIAEGRLAGLAAAASLGLASDELVLAEAAAGGGELAWRAGERAAMHPVHVQPYV